MKAGIIDYGAGNLRSAANAVSSLGFEPRLLRAPADFDDSLTHLILPGVGAFGDSMEEMNRRQLVEPIRQWIAADKPFFGICVGYQMLFESGEESPGIPGLGIFQGTVRRFPESVKKIPHMGWNAAVPVDPANPQFAELGPQPFFYFVHSFYPEPVDTSLTAMRSDYEGVSFVSAIQRGRLFATQFHPEKSQKAGLQLLANFLQSPA